MHRIMRGSKRRKTKSKFNFKLLIRAGFALIKCITQRFARPKTKREYDSDEEEEAKEAGGTWEHKLRNAEMEATRG